MSKNPLQSEGYVLKMKRRTQEFLNASEANAAKSFKNRSENSQFTDFHPGNDLQESKSQGRAEESVMFNPFNPSQPSEYVDNDKYGKLVQGK